MANILDPEVKVLVTVEDPVFFEAMVRAWEAGGHTGLLTEEERNYKGTEEPGPGEPTSPEERTTEQRLEFASYIRDFGHQMDLERASRRPVISLSLTPPHGFPAVPADPAADSVPRGRHHGGAIQVTRRARALIESGPQPQMTAAVQPTEIIPVIEVGEANAPDDTSPSGDD